VLFVASHAPLDGVRDGPRALAAWPEFYRAYGIETREDLLASLALDTAGTRRLGAGAPIIHDDWNLLQMRSPGIRGRGLTTVTGRRVFASADERAAPPAGIDAPRYVRILLGAADEERAARVAAALEEPVARVGAQGLIALSRNDLAGAGRHLEAALRLDPGNAEVRGALLRLRRPRLAAGSAPVAALAFPDPTPGEAALIEAWRRQRQGDWAGVRELDASLAGIGGGDALYAEAIRLRAGWRVASGEPERAREARELLGLSLARTFDADDLVLRARAALVAGEPPVALGTLSELQQRLVSVRIANPRWLARRARLARDALRVLDEVPVDEAQPARASALREQFRTLVDGWLG
jgi:hypothetical protein